MPLNCFRIASSRKASAEFDDLRAVFTQIIAQVGRSDHQTCFCAGFQLFHKPAWVFDIEKAYLKWACSIINLSLKGFTIDIKSLQIGITICICQNGIFRVDVQM